uniref:Transmembrane protein n=1 Tax=Medicago truncatula TaxID=3880 RepID=I3T2Z5_MEDTR|nr:unknown [Medicago truncatula]
MKVIFKFSVIFLLRSRVLLITLFYKCIILLILCVSIYSTLHS